MATFGDDCGSSAKSYLDEDVASLCNGALESKFLKMNGVMEAYNAVASAHVYIVNRNFLFLFKVLPHVHFKHF